MAACLLANAGSREGWWGRGGREGQRERGGFTSLREAGGRRRVKGVWQRQGRNTSLASSQSSAEYRVEQRGGDTVIEFARSGEAQGECRGQREGLQK